MTEVPRIRIPDDTGPFLIKKRRSLKTWQKLLWLSPIIIVALLYKGFEWYREYRLDNDGVHTIGRISIAANTGLHNLHTSENIAFSFMAGDFQVNAYAEAPVNNNYAFTPYGMPISAGDEFEVTYLPSDPEIYRIDFSKPGEKTKAGYIFTVASVLCSLEIVKPEISCLCVAEAVWKHYGYDGLASIWFNNEYLAENLTNNAFTFKSLTESEEFKTIIDSCSLETTKIMYGEGNKEQ